MREAAGLGAVGKCCCVIFLTYVDTITRLAEHMLRESTLIASVGKLSVDVNRETNDCRNPRLFECFLAAP